MIFTVHYEDGEPKQIETEIGGGMIFYMYGSTAIYSNNTKNVSRSTASHVVEKLEEELPFVQAVEVYNHK